MMPAGEVYVVPFPAGQVVEAPSCLGAIATERSLELGILDVDMVYVGASSEGKKLKVSSPIT